MFYIGLLIRFYLLALLAAGMIGLLVLHAGFLRAVLRQWPSRTDVRYSRFVKQHASRKRAILLLVKFPLAAAVVLSLFSLGTRTGQVRNHITASTRLVVRTGGNCCRDPEHEKQLYETEDAESIRRLADQISLKLDLFARQCQCCGEITFDLYKGDNLHYSFSFHHGRHIRVKDSWSGDLRLTSQSRQNLARWLTEQGAQERLTSIEERERRLRQVGPSREGAVD